MQTGEVMLASAAEVADAVKVAVDASVEWGASPMSRRVEVMFRLRELVHAHHDDLAAIITREHGKVRADARGEVARGLECVEFACGIPQLLKGAHSSEVSTGVDVHTVVQPVGVVAGITPFNFPVMVPLWMLANALACGNAFVLKPSEKDPSASLLLAELVQRAGFPDGVFNVVQGDAEAVDALLAHPDVAAVSFVGSTPVARHVYETGTRHGKRVQALGGAKNHMVVLPDADVDAAADAAVSAAYGSAGERCMAISVVVAVGSVADAVVGAIEDRIPGVVVGPGDDDASMMGPLITREHRDRVRSYVTRAADEGARVVVDGSAAVHRRRVLPRLFVDRRRRAGDACLRRRDLRSGAERGTSGDVRRRPGAREREPPRQRRRVVHARRWRGAAVRTRGRSRHGGGQRADPGAGRVAFVRWMEGVVVRRQRHVRAGRRPVLHAAEGRHFAVAGSVVERDRPRVSHEPMTRAGVA